MPESHVQRLWMMGTASSSYCCMFVWPLQAEDLMEDPMGIVDDSCSLQDVCYRVTRPPFFFFSIAMILSFSGSNIFPFPSSLVLYVCRSPCRAPNHMLPPSLSSNYKTQIPHPALLFHYLLMFPSATPHSVVQHHTLLAGVYHGLFNEHQPLHMYHHR